MASTRLAPPEPVAGEGLSRLLEVEERLGRWLATEQAQAEELVAAARRDAATRKADLAGEMEQLAATHRTTLEAATRARLAAIEAATRTRLAALDTLSAESHARVVRHLVDELLAELVGQGAS